MTFILTKFIRRLCSDTITFKKIISLTLNLHFRIFIYKLIFRKRLNIILTCYLYSR